VTDSGQPAIRFAVLADENGQILVGFLQGAAKESDGAPQTITFVPKEGEIACEVDLPDELLDENGMLVHSLADYRVVTGGVDNRLVRYKSNDE